MTPASSEARGGVLRSSSLPLQAAGAADTAARSGRILVPFTHGAEPFIAQHNCTWHPRRRNSRLPWSDGRCRLGTAAASADTSETDVLRHALELRRHNCRLSLPLTTMSHTHSQRVWRRLTTSRQCARAQRRFSSMLGLTDAPPIVSCAYAAPSRRPGSDGRHLSCSRVPGVGPRVG